MTFQIMKKDPERTWVVCKLCGGAFDARKASRCDCGNISSQVDKAGASYIEADDSDAVVYDTDK